MSKLWYALYVKSRTEKKVAAEFEAQGIDYYLPIQKVLKQWSDRKKWVEEPLFRSYIFVRIELDDYYKVLQTPNAVKYISFEGKAVVVPPPQIEAIKYFLNEKDPENPDTQSWTKGKKVEIVSGSLVGLIGELVDVNGKNRVSIEIEALNRTILLQIPKSRLRVI
jgi:transcription antitermination factor NusG